MIQGKETGAKTIALMMCSVFLFTFVSACGSGGSGSNRRTVTQGLSVFVADLPAESGSTIWLITLAADGTVDSSTSLKAEEFVTLTTQPNSTPFNVVAHIPDSSDWSAGNSFGPGHYALFTSQTDQNAKLRVSYWTKSDSLFGVSDGGLKKGDQEDSTGTIEGRVRNQHFDPVAGAIVQVKGQAWAVTGSDGFYILEKIRTGTVSVTTSGTDGTEVSEPTEVFEGETTTVNLTVTADATSLPTTTWTFKVKDKTTGAPIAGATVKVEAPWIDVSETTNSSGEVSVEGPQDRLFAVTVTMEHYSIRWYKMVMYGSTVQATFEILPLMKQFYGSWSYCHHVYLDCTTPFAPKDCKEGDTHFPEFWEAGDSDRDLTFLSDGTLGWTPPFGHWYAKESTQFPGLYYTIQPVRSFAGSKNGTAHITSVPPLLYSFSNDGKVMTAQTEASFFTSGAVYAKNSDDCPKPSTQTEPPDLTELCQELVDLWKESAKSYPTACQKNCVLATAKCFENAKCSEDSTSTCGGSGQDCVNGCQ